MSEVWTILGICVVVLLGAALPLLRSSGSGVPASPPRKPLHDSRNDN